MSRSRRYPNRWHFGAALATATALVIASCGGDDGGGAETDAESSATTAPEPPSTVEEAGFAWDQFSGESIRVVLNQHPWQDTIEPLIPEFEALTGIDVEVEKLPEEQFRQRVQVELTAGTSDLDVYMTSLLNEGARFAQNGWYRDLRPFLDDPSLTSPDYDVADFGDGLIDSHTIDGTLIGIPIQLETQMLYYRKDILDAAGVEVPTTMDELEAVAQAIHDPDGVNAFVARGKGRAAVTQISTYLYNFGGAWTEPGSFDAAFNTAEGLAAFDFYTRMLREYGPRGTTNMSWEEALPLFAQGRVAMFTDASTFMPNILSDGSQEVIDNIGYAAMPSGPGGDFQTFFGWAIGMSAFTNSPDASWLFIQWATSPDIVQRVTDEGSVVGGRGSVDFGPNFPAEWVDAFKASLPTARPQLPQVLPVSEVRDVIGVAIIDGIEGKDLERALDDAARQFDATVAASE